MYRIIALNVLFIHARFCCGLTPILLLVFNISCSAGFISLPIYPKPAGCGCVVPQEDVCLLPRIRVSPSGSEVADVLKLSRAESWYELLAFFNFCITTYLLMGTTSIMHGLSIKG